MSVATGPAWYEEVSGEEGWGSWRPKPAENCMILLPTDYDALVKPITYDINYDV